MNLVTVVTPCLNPGVRLERCLASVAAQTHPNLEHVVVDGGSTDGTVELLERRGVRYVSEPDEGQAHAIAKGFALAAGTLLTWLNADDTLTPTAVERAIATGRDWIYGDCAVLRHGERRVWRPPRRYGAWQIAAGEMIPQPGAFFSRTAFERVGGLDRSFEYVMDIDLWIRFVDAGVEARYVPGIAATFEIHEDSKTGSAGRPGFFREHARALAKSGRYGAASAALGRAVAFGDADQLPVWADQAIVRAAAAAERGVEGVRARDPRRAARLLAPHVWRHRESRMRILAALRREVRLA